MDPITPGRSRRPHTTSQPAAAPTAPGTENWRTALPTLVGAMVTLRELEMSDAATLVPSMGAEAVSRFISTPPGTVDEFNRFIQWAHRQRAEGQFACFGVVPHGSTTPVGIFQLRPLQQNSTVAEWGAALDAACWGSGYFLDGSRLLIDFAVDIAGVHRLEARSAVANGRGNAALRKLGAVHEGVLRRAFTKDGRQMDQALWAILADEWRQAKTVWHPAILH